MILFDEKKFRSNVLPTLEQITASWKKRDLGPIVSVVCTTFNQDAYIQDALAGFLRQRTSFPFEIVVHDDASTDQTRDILESYVVRYPGLIKYIRQTENQYSKGKKPSLLAVGYAQGEYVAMCEGDDFWISPSKLETQYFAMLNNGGVEISFHPAIFYKKGGGQKIVGQGSVSREVFTLSDVIRGGGEFMPTASIMVKRKVFESLPDWFSKAPVGDYYIQIFGSLHGALYLPEACSVYRVMSSASWSSEIRSGGEEKLCRLAERQNEALISTLKSLGSDYAEDISYARARESLGYGKLALMSGYFNLSRSLFSQSWTTCRSLGWQQKVLYFSRNRLKLLRFVIRALKAVQA